MLDGVLYRKVNAYKNGRQWSPAAAKAAAKTGATAAAAAAAAATKECRGGVVKIYEKI